MWPKCNFFGLFESIDGVNCAEFLKDNLHKFIVGNEYFPDKPRQAILNGFRNAETHFLKIIDKH